MGENYSSGNQFNGWLDEFIVFPYALGSSQVSTLDSRTSAFSGIWTDITSDVLREARIILRWGMMDISPETRVARTGTMSLALRNDAGNSGGIQGYYSPNHASSRSGFEIGAGLRLKLTYSGSTRYKWQGMISSIQPDAGQFGQRRARIEALDWIDTAGKRKMRLINTAFNQTADQALATVISSMSNLPPASSLASGQSTFPTVFDNVRDEQTTVLREINKLVISEMGYAYIKGSSSTGGLFQFDDRHTRAKYGDSSASFNDTMAGLDVQRANDRIFNRIRLEANPRETSSAASVLFTLQSTPSVAAGASIAFDGRYTDPSQRGAIRVGGASIVTPASTTDYTMNSASDGTGTDLTSSFTVSTSPGGNSISVAASNGSGTSGYITLFQVRGRVIAIKEPTTADQSSASSIATYGENVLSMSLPYQSDQNTATDLAVQMLAAWKDPKSIGKQVNIIGNVSDALMSQVLWRDVGDKVTITETVTGVDEDYFINGVELTIEALDRIEAKWILIPSTAEGLTVQWLLGTAGYSELGTTTALGA